MDKLKTYLGWTVDFTVPAGAPAYCEPDSVRWKVFKNPVTSVIAGVCAVLLEFADDRIRSGVWDHSVFPTDPIGRGQRTGTAAMVGIYGPQAAAQRVIRGITNMHAKVEGTTPNGRAYKALDTELLNWVSATATYGWFTAYDRFAKLDDFYAMMNHLEGDFEPHPINGEFLDIMRSGRAARGLPVWIQRALAHAAIDILPPSVRQVLGLGKEYDLTFFERAAVKAAAWAAETIPAKNSPPAEACERLGLPRDFLWKSEAAQARLLKDWRAARTPSGETAAAVS